MKGFKFKCFLGLGVLIIVGLGFAFWGLNRIDSRIPASLEKLKIIPELGLYERQGSTYFTSLDEYDICDDRKEVLLVLEARGVAVLSETNPQIQIQITSDCDRRFDSPVFSKSFCTQGLIYEDDDGVLYKMINSMGFFPREWAIKKFLIGGMEISMDNQPVLSNYIFSCN